MLNRLIYSYGPDMTLEFVLFAMLFWSVLFTGGYILYKAWKKIFKSLGRWNQLKVNASVVMQKLRSMKTNSAKIVPV